MARKLKTLLDTRAVGVYANAAMHTPIGITIDAVEQAKALGDDSIVSVGEGSTIGLGKALSFQLGLPHICIPITYAGSEMTPILGETDKGVKTTKRDPKFLPGTVIYDPDLTLNLPGDTSATSGVNALADAVEALYATDTNPIIILFAKEGIQAVLEALVVIRRPFEMPMLYARLCTAHGSAASACVAPRCLCITSFAIRLVALPHSETHSILLPHTIAYSSTAAPEAMRDLADALPGSDEDAIQGLNQLLDRLGVNRA